jgi:hypothetical protein
MKNLLQQNGSSYEHALEKMLREMITKMSAISDVYIVMSLQSCKDQLKTFSFNRNKMPCMPNYLLDPFLFTCHRLVHF